MLILTEEALTEHDVNRIVELHAPDPIRAHVVIPSGTDQSTLDRIVDDLARTDMAELGEDVDSVQPDAVERARDAQTRLDASVQLLIDSGVSATGSLVPDHPVAATAALAEERDVDELIVITEPHLITDMLRRDWGSQLRRKVQRPLLHFISGTDEVIN